MATEKEKWVVVYFDHYCACCDVDDNDDDVYFTHEEILKQKKMFGKVYFAKESDVKAGKVWGDDWNDRPSCCNSGSPYTSDIEIRTINLCYGKELEEAKQ